MRADKVEIIRKAANEIAAQAVLIEREVDATGEIQALLETIYATADEIRELAESPDYDE